MAVEWDLQAAIYTALTGDVALMAVVNAVYDRKPQDSDSGTSAEYPFLTLTIIINSWDTKTELGSQALVRIHTHTRTGSAKQCKQIQGLIYSALHRNEPAMAGYNFVSLERESTEALDDDGHFHGVCDYNALIQTN